MASQLWTYSDVLEAMLDWQGANPQPQMERQSRRAILAALDEVSQAHHWSFYYRDRFITTSAPYSTGTIQYDHSGGSYERVVVLTSGTWPTWAADGVLRIGTVNYEVLSRQSTTELQLSINSNPGADVAAGTSYTLYRDGYVLPVDCWTIDELYAEETGRHMGYVHPRDWLHKHRVNSTGGQPTHYSVMGSDDYQGEIELVLYPYPDAAETLAFIYSRRPRKVVFENVKAGTASVTASSTTVTGTNTAFTSAMIGSLIRISSNAAEYPTGREGANPFAFERAIVAVNSATSLEMDQSVNTSYSGVKYVISDPIDIDVALMGRAFMRCAEAIIGKQRRLEDRTALDAEYQKALILAKEADTRSTAPRAVGGHWTGIQSLADYPSAADED